MGSMTKLRSFATKVRTLNTSKLKPSPKKADPFYLSEEWRDLMRLLIKQRGRRCEDPDHIGGPSESGDPKAIESLGTTSKN
jgi:hypothetical protein